MKGVDYHLSRNRYKELKHFCLQYPEWKQSYLELLGGRTGPGDVTSNDAVKLADYSKAMTLIEMTAKDTSFIFGVALLKFVTGEMTFNELDLDIDKDVFERYLNRFYWLLSERKGI